MSAAEGYEEVPHTADLALRVWGPTLTSLLEHAALGTVWLTRCELPPDSHSEQHDVALEAVDLESLLISWLNEILYLVSNHYLHPEAFQFHAAAPRLLSVSVHGRAPAQAHRGVKAATFHDLRIVETPSGYQAVVVFDV